MSNESRPAPPISQFELYRVVSWVGCALTLALIFKQHPYLFAGVRRSAIVLGVGLILFVALRSKQHFVVLLVCVAYVFAERDSLAGRVQRSLTADDFWLSGAVLCTLTAAFRATAAQAAKGDAPKKKPLLRRLVPQFRRRPAPLAIAAETSPAEVGELVRMAALLPLWVLLGHAIYRIAPVQAIEAFQLPLAPEHVLLLALLLLLGSVIIVARVVLGSIERERLDPLCAEMELNDLVWRELRPELRGINNSLGKASRREKT